MKIEEFLSPNDKAVLQYVSSAAFVKWYQEFFYGKESTNGVDKR